MKAIRFSEYGAPDVLRYEDAPAPQPGPDQVLVRIKDASVNAMEAKLVAGYLQSFVPVEFPSIPGGDFAGVVEAVHDDVTGFKPGDAVYGCSGFGGSYAQLAAVPQNNIARKPESLSFLEAASIPVAAITAWQGLFDHGQLREGQTVLIHAAAGGVGSMAVQLAHWKGARVLATASEANRSYLEALGADTVIDYKTTRFEDVARDVDLVLDLIGGETQKRSLGVVRTGGRLVSAVGPAEDPSGRVQASGMSMQPTTALLDTLTGLIESGAIKPTVTDTFPLSEAARAVAESASGHTRGKIVLEVEP